MNKEEFLRQLQERIRILQPSEQQDILEEYAQHIQMRMEGGLSEEEAIRDFGSLDDLAAEILEAYHISPDWQSKIKEPSAPVKEAAIQCAGWLERFWHKCQTAWGKLCNWLSGQWQNLQLRLKKEEVPEQDVPEQPKPEKPPKQPRPHTFWGWIKDMNRRLWGMIGALFAWSIRVAKVLCRWAWNATLLCAAVPVVCTVGFFLVCAGTLGVLLVQGYPALGLLLGSIGIVVCGCGVLVFACTLIWKKPNNMHKEVGDHA